MRVCLWSRKVITSVPPLILRSCRGCGLGELAGSRALFLQEQVRDLRVQEFLRELIVGVATPSDLARSILVKILHCDESGDVKQVVRISKQFSRVCDCSSLSHSLVFYIFHAYIVHIFIYSIYTYALLIYLLGLFNILHALIPCTFIACLCLCSHLYSTKRAIVAPQLLI